MNRSIIEPEILPREKMYRIIVGLKPRINEIIDFRWTNPTGHHYFPAIIVYDNGDCMTFDWRDDLSGRGVSLTILTSGTTTNGVTKQKRHRRLHCPKMENTFGDVWYVTETDLADYAMHFQRDTHKL